MKKSSKILCLVIAFIVVLSSVSISAFALENTKNYYYFDAINGDDRNSGTDINNPIKTIDGLKELKIGPGTHFLFKNGGEYECAVLLTCSGTKENPVVISSYGEGDRAILKTDEKTELLKYGQPEIEFYKWLGTGYTKYTQEKAPSTLTSGDDITIFENDCISFD